MSSDHQMPLVAALTVDVDSLASIYKGYGLKLSSYTGLEVRQGLENLCHFFEPYGIQTTLFMVGNDFLNPQNIPYIQATAAAGHEIANHTMTHAQGYRTLSLEEQEKEIREMEEICEQTIGVKPLGFRAPGWNMSDKALPILLRRGYLYDSSIHPTIAAPLLKLLHWLTAPERNHGGRTTLGQWDYISASYSPYHTSAKRFTQEGKDGIMEFPISVVPPLRFPFWHTITLAQGLEYFFWAYKRIKKRLLPINYLLHISDFVDYSHPELQQQMPMNTHRRIPKALRMTWDEKKQILCQVIESMAHDYTFLSLKNLHKIIDSRNNTHYESKPYYL